MSGAVCKILKCRFSIVHLFLSGCDPGTNSKSGMALVLSILAKRLAQPNQMRAWRDSNPQPSDPKSEALSG